jgi:hypothetical protein
MTTHELPMQLLTIFKDIAVERERQEDLKRKGKFLWTCSDVLMDQRYVIEDSAKLAVLAEEFGEVSREVMEAIISADKREPLDPNQRLKLRKELIEVASVCVAWCEAIDQRMKERESNESK